jgi:DNA-binding transcriptional regulator GbsR (MarR family)
VSTVTQVREAFVQLWGALGPFWGVSPTTARVFGWLLSQPEGGDAEEIMKALDLSRGAVSMACRDLRNWGLIFPEKTPGSRRVFYRPETDLEKVTRNVVQIRKQREWDPIREHLSDWIPELKADPSPEAGVFLERLKAIEALVTMADTMAEAFLKGGSVGSFGFKVLAGAGRAAKTARTAASGGAGSGSNPAPRAVPDDPATSRANSSTATGGRAATGPEG